MTNDDLKQIDQLLAKRFDAIDNKLKTHDKKFDAHDKKFDAIDKRFDAIDDRFSVMEKSFDEKLSKNKDEIIDEVTDDIIGFMEKNLFPKLENMAEKSDIERIERRIDSLAVRVGNHEVRIKDIEYIPVVALQLKIKKKK